MHAAGGMESIPAKTQVAGLSSIAKEVLAFFDAISGLLGGPIGIIEHSDSIKNKGK